MTFNVLIRLFHDFFNLFCCVTTCWSDICFETCWSDSCSSLS
jgi:hypothetical protein